MQNYLPFQARECSHERRDSASYQEGGKRAHLFYFLENPYYFVHTLHTRAGLSIYKSIKGYGVCSNRDVIQEIVAALDLVDSGATVRREEVEADRMEPEEGARRGEWYSSLLEVFHPSFSLNERIFGKSTSFAPAFHFFSSFLFKAYAKSHN